MFSLMDDSYMYLKEKNMKEAEVMGLSDLHISLNTAKIHGLSTDLLKFY